MTPTTSRSTTAQAAAGGVDACVRALGFSPRGVGEYILDEMTLGIEAAWATFEMPQPLSAELNPLSGARLTGLWKYSTAPREVKRRFDLPLSEIVSQGPWSPEGNALLGEAMAWPLATAGGTTGEWTPPPEAEIPLSDSELIVQCGRFIRHGRLLRGDRDLRIRVPIIDGPAYGLGKARRQWLRALLFDAQNRWRMVRILCDEPHCSVEAEIDLTGAPHGAIGSMMRIGTDVLRGLVSWLIDSVDLLADNAVPLAAPDICPVRKHLPLTERKNK